MGSLTTELQYQPLNFNRLMTARRMTSLMNQDSLTGRLADVINTTDIMAGSN